MVILNDQLLDIRFVQPLILLESVPCEDGTNTKHKCVYILCIDYFFGCMDK